MNIFKICTVIALIGIEFFGPFYAFGKEPQDIIMFSANSESRGKAGVPPAQFSHSAHNKKLKCNDCHPSIFEEKIGAANVTMKKNMSGEYCGKCHTGEKAFDLSNCDRCHKK